MSQTDGDTDEQGTQDGVVLAEQGPDRDQMAADYMPDSEHWAAKTDLDEHDPGAIAALRNMDQMFPEVEDLQPLIDNVIDEHLPARTSVNGHSRDEYQKMIMSMFGGQGSVEETRAWAAALGADNDE